LLAAWAARQPDARERDGADPNALPAGRTPIIHPSRQLQHSTQVVAALAALYDRHKGSYGWEDRPLSIE
jgi:hypothetical protein